jgi:hypothetical protein
LQHVFGVFARRQHVPAKAEQSRPIPRNKRFKRTLVAATHQRHQALIRSKPQKRIAANRNNIFRICDRRSFHSFNPLHGQRKDSARPLDAPQTSRATSLRLRQLTASSVTALEFGV